MSCFKLYNELNIQFSEIQKVSFLLNNRDLECVNALENWFVSTENILKKNNCCEKDIIAQYRGQLMIERLRADLILPRRKRELNAVSKLIEPIKNTILKIIEPMSDKIEKSKVIITQLLQQKEFNWNEGLNYRDYILAVWRTLLNEQNTQTEAKMVLKLIGEEDVLKLISNKLKPANKPLD